MSFVWKRLAGKRILLTLLLALLVFSLSSCSFSLESALAELKAYVNGTEVPKPPEGFVESRENKLFTYDVYREYVIVTGYLGEELEVVIPEKIDRLPVYAIAGLAFYESVPVESVMIPEGVEVLEENAFYYCTALKTVSLPESLHTIGDKAFSWCSSLEEITLPDAVTAIPAYCFNQCTLLKQIRISSAVTSVGARAFSGCESLTSLYFGDAMLALGDYAFRGCKALETVRLSGDCVLSASAMVDRPDTLTVMTMEDSLCWETCKELGVLLTPDDGSLLLPEESIHGSGDIPLEDFSTTEET